MSTFNDELDNISTRLKAENEKGCCCPSQSSVSIEIQPNDKVLFNGKKATVLSTWPNSEDVVILQDGMTIDCSKKQLKTIGKIDVVDVPMKFKNGLPVSESKKVFVRCNLVGDSSPLNVITENIFVDFSEWSRKKGKQKVRLVCEDYQETFDAPKNDIMLLDLPDGNLGKDDGYVPGAIVDSEGGPERKVMIHANVYATTTDDSVKVPVLFITKDGYKDGMVPKSMLKTLSV